MTRFSPLCNFSYVVRAATTCLCAPPRLNILHPSYLPKSQQMRNLPDGQRPPPFHCASRTSKAPTPSWKAGGTPSRHNCSKEPRRIHHHKKMWTKWCLEENDVDEIEWNREPTNQLKGKRGNDCIISQHCHLLFPIASLGRWRAFVTEPPSLCADTPSHPSRLSWNVGYCCISVDLFLKTLII